MADNYYYKLNDGGVTLKVVDEIGPFNTWEDITQPNDCIIVPSGIVTEIRSPQKLVCQSGPPDGAPVVTLYGASWATKVGDTGIAEGHLVNGCSPTSWEMVRKT